MNNLPEPIHNLVSWFNRLPGIGPKTSLRFVFHLLKMSKHELSQFAKAINELPDKITVCPKCQTYTTKPLCDVCANPKRDDSTLCVISEPRDMQAVENTGEYQGRYFVLGGLVQPIEGITPDKLKFKELEQMVSQSPAVKEIIFAFNADIEGETTMLHLTKLLKKYPVRITRLARGLPVGSELEYADQITLSDALRGRREI